MSQYTERDALIDVRNISKSYKMGTRTVHALKSVSMQIFRGQSVAIMGPSGSGKSTLLHLLGCLDSPSEGVYYFDNEDVSTLSDRKLAEIRSQKIGMIFQSFNLIPQLNVVENIEVPFLYQKSAPKNYSEIILHALKKVGLSHRKDHLPSELSGGEMQRVAIARALAINPLVILADEPTGNLDSTNGKVVLDLLIELQQQGVTVIMVTHDPKVGACCQRKVSMHDGYLLG